MPSSEHDLSREIMLAVLAFDAQRSPQSHGLLREVPIEPPPSSRNVSLFRGVVDTERRFVESVGVGDAVSPRFDVCTHHTLASQNIFLCVRADGRMCGNARIALNASIAERYSVHPKCSNAPDTIAGLYYL